MVYENFKFKITVYFVTSVHISTLNIVSTKKTTHKNIKKQKDRDAFDFQNIKRVGQSLYYVSFYSFILADNIVIYFSFVIIYSSLLKHVTVTAHFLQ